MYQIFSGHDFAEFQKLCNFMSVNLDNSMMKHLKQKLIALLCVTFAVVSAWANDSVVWHHPVVGYTHSIVEVTKVVLHADRTEVSCHVHYPSGYWIQILRTTELQTDGRNFPVRDASGIPLGERYTMPESDEVDFTLTFDAVPLGTVKMNLVEPGGWTVYNIRPEDYREENGGIIFPNPNAPTSHYEDLSVIREILDHNQDVIVIVDEAYIDFAGESALSLLDDYENLLIVQTFSKSRSMAGMRIGYAIGHPELIKAMNDVKYSFNSYTMSQTALALGVEAVRDDVYFKACTAKIRATREKAKQVFTDLGFTYPEPGANFIFVTHPDYPAKELFAALRKKDIYVRYFDKPRINNYLRVTIGTDEQMEALFAFLKEYMNR